MPTELPTDFHVQCRDTIAGILQHKLAEYGLLSELPDGKVHTHATPNIEFCTKPAVIVSFEGTEYEIGEGTNLRKDIGYPVLIGLYTLDPKSDPPGMPLTLFRQIVQDLFSGRRLGAIPNVVAGIPNVMFCNYNGQPEIMQDSFPAVKDLRTAMTVTPIMRRLR